MGMKTDTRFVSRPAGARCGCLSGVSIVGRPGCSIGLMHRASLSRFHQGRAVSIGAARGGGRRTTGSRAGATPTTLAGAPMATATDRPCGGEPRRVSRARPARRRRSRDGCASRSGGRVRGQRRMSGAGSMRCTTRAETPVAQDRCPAEPHAGDRGAGGRPAEQRPALVPRSVSRPCGARACNRRGSEPPGPATACPVTRERDFPSDHLTGYALPLPPAKSQAVPCIP